MKISGTVCIFVLCFVTGISSVTYHAICNDAKKCDKGLDCHIELEGCKTGKCVCPKTHKWDEKKCKKIVTINASCEGDNTCDTKLKLVCGAKSKKCECPADRVWNDKVKKCIGKGLAVLGEDCDAKDNKKLCYASHCVNAKCGCVAGAQFGMECRLPRKGESCKPHITCDGTDVVCNDKKICSCKKAEEIYVASNKTCKVAGKGVQGNDCKADSDCSGELLCRQCMKIDGKLEKHMCVGHKPHTETTKTTPGTQTTVKPKDKGDNGGSSVVIPPTVVAFAAFLVLILA